MPERRGGYLPQVAALWVVLLVLLRQGSAQAAGDGDSSAAAEEVAALLLFKQGLTNSEQVAELSTWSSDADSPCSWEGVTCDDSGAVTSLDLHGLGLQGTIAPSSIAQLQHLNSLDLSGNSLTGSIPVGWNKDGALPSLYTLNLTNNQLTQAPADWGTDGCSALREIRLNRNELTTLPDGWTFLQLQELKLAGNRISGSIPTTWSLSSDAVVEVLPQASNSTICGLVPQRPTFQYDDALHAPFNLSNSLGSCFARPGKCANTATAVSLSGTNLYDASIDADAAVWDTLALNPSINPLYTSSAVVALPCYEEGSPVGKYLGGDMAYMRPAWGSAPGGWRVTSMVPPAWPEQCYTATTLGAFWAVDLGDSVKVSMVILRVGPGGLNHAAITVGNSPNPSGEPCATVDAAEANTTTALHCKDSGRYLHVTASPAFTGSCVSLCSLSVYPKASSVAVNKLLTLSQVYSVEEPPLLQSYTEQYIGPKTSEDDISPNASLWEQLPGYAAQGRPKAAAALSLGYAAPIAGVHFWGDYNLFDVLVANSSLNASGAPPKGVYCDRGFGSGALASPIAMLPDGSVEATDGPDVVVTGANNGTFNCRGAVGEYIVVVGAGQNMKLNGIEVFLAQQPGGTPATDKPPLASPPPPSSPLPSITPNSSAIEDTDASGSSGSDSSDSGSSGSSTAAIVGGVVGGVALLVAAAMLAWWYMRRRSSSHDAFDDTKGLSKQASETTPDHDMDVDIEGSPVGCLTESPTDSGPEFLADGSLASRTTGARSGSAPNAIDPLLDLVSMKLTSRRMLGPFLSFSGPPLPTTSDPDKNVSGRTTPRSSQRSLQKHLSGDSWPCSSGGLPVLSEWLVSYEDIHMQKLIGEGSFGRVYLARWHETNVACKLLLNTGVNVDDLDAAAELAISLSNPILHNLQQEAGMMAALRHPNIVGFLGVCPSPPCVLTEYCKRGSLFDVLRAAKNSPARAKLLDWPRRLNMALDAAKGLLYLHSHKPKPVVHRDLKSPNLLVDVHWRIKVSDFNLSKIMEESNAASVGIASNPRWLAPEILAGKSATFASDVYSYGTILWELATWDCPWGTMNSWQVVSEVTDGAQLQFPPAQELRGGGFERLDEYITLARACWALDPQQRPGMAEVIADLRQILAETVGAGGAAATAVVGPKE